MGYSMRKNKTYHRKKTVLLWVLCMGMMVGLAGRLVYLCVFRSVYYSEKADDLHERERGIKAARGRILDANGEVLAANRTVCTISVIHSQIEEPEAVIAMLVKELGIDYTVIPSGAFHDSLIMTSVFPTGMIFVPSKDGISHSRYEYTAPEDIENGCNVLLNTVLKLDEK